MKKIYYLLPLIAALVTACGTGNQKQENKEFALTGKFADNKINGNLFLQSYDYKSDKYQNLDTMKVTDGAFTLTHDIDSAVILYIAGEGISKPQMFVAEEGNIEIAFDSAAVAIAKGTPLNSAYQEYVDKRNSFNVKMREVSKLSSEAAKEKKLTPEYEKELDDKYNSLYDELRNYTFGFVKSNIDNPVGKFILLDRGRSFDLAQLEEVVPKAASLKTNPKFDLIEKRLHALKTTSVGEKFTDIKAQTPDGKEIALSDYAGKGKYVLVDFWASWCPPCRKEMPEVVKIYNQYKNKGFEIVGVSLDSKKEDWEKGIKDLNISWPQMSDLNRWDSQLSTAYAVNSIPHMVLLDKEGKIIARGINAHELSAKLKELL